MGKFIDVYSKRTGKKHTVPAHWMDSPRLSKPFSRTPKQRAADAAAAAPPPPPPAATVSDADTRSASATPSNIETRATGDKE